jgi:uncharacterized membrane protein
MKNENAWEDSRFWLWVFFRIVFATIIVMIALGILVERPMVFYPGWFWNLIGILIFVWFISWILRWPFRHRCWEHGHEIRILRRRYARGEITEAQFKKMMKVLKEDSRNKR